MTRQTSPLSPLSLVVAIVNRGMGGKATALFAKQGIVFSLSAHGRGTANSRLLDVLGLGESAKEVLFCTVPSNRAAGMLALLERDLQLKEIGKGIAFSVPLGSVIGTKTAAVLAGIPQETGTSNEWTDEGGMAVEQPARFDLIITVANRGYADEVMEAAKSVRPIGGTILGARGTGMKEAEKFFGLTIQPEKEMVLIVTPAEDRQAIMEAIVTKAGPRTEAGAIAFSLPVSGVAGLRPYKAPHETDR